MIRLKAVRSKAACLSLVLLSSLVITPAAVSALSSDSSVSAQAQADFQKGEALMNGIGVEQNLGKAKQLLQKAAEQGHTEAQVLLGRLHYYMPGEVDLEKTRYWWLEAARQGHPRAQYQLAILYLKRGDADPLEAMAWMHMARASGEPRAEQVWPKMQEQFEVDSVELATRLAELKSDMGLQVTQSSYLLAAAAPVSEINASVVRSELVDANTQAISPELRAEAGTGSVKDQGATTSAQSLVMSDPVIEPKPEIAEKVKPEPAVTEPSSPAPGDAKSSTAESAVGSTTVEEVFPEGFYVQLASVKDSKGAELLAAKVAKKQKDVLGSWVPRVKYLADQGSYKIWVGAFSARGEASVLCESLQAHKQDCFVVRH